MNTVISDEPFLPPAFGSWVGKIGSIDKKLTLPKDIAFLVRQRVAQINTCSFCIDIGRFVAMKEQVSEAKIDALDDYATSPLFSEKERAALDYATELTRDKSVSPAAIERLKAQFTEREVCEIVWLIATEHVYNVANIGLNIHSDMLCKV
jgi:alkylhydroperoxidase family enzyme